MPKLRNAFWLAIGILALTGLVGWITPTAIAQVRAALVRDLDGPVRGLRYAEGVQMIFDLNSFSVTEAVTPAIPAGKKLFLQSVNTHTLLTDGQSLMEARLSIFNPSLVARFSIDQDFQAAGTTQRHFTGNLAVNMVVNPGESLSIFLFRNDNLGSPSLNFANVSLTGYFFDATP